MVHSQKFTVRPSERTDLKDTFNIFLSSTALLSLKLTAGDTCFIAVDESCRGTAIACTPREKIKDTVVQTSKLMQKTYGLRLGQDVSITRTEEPIPEVDVATIKVIPEQSLLTTDKSHWEWFLEHPLSRAEYVCSGMPFETLELKGEKKSFQVQHISSQTYTSQNLYRFSSRSKAELLDGSSSGHPPFPEPLDLEKIMTGVGGLKRQIEQIKEQLHDLHSNSPKVAMPSYYHGNSGILLYGPKGTGKSLVLRKLATGSWRKTFNIDSTVMNQDNGAATVRKIFNDARHCEPSVVLIDQLEFLAPKRSARDGAFASTLAPVFCEILDNLDQSRVFVVSATRHPNDVDETLRTPNRFGLELELPAPSAMARKEILQAIRGLSDEPNDGLLDYAAGKTHGFVGADLFALLQVACRKARSRSISNETDHVANSDDVNASNADPLSKEALTFEMIEQDLTEALTEVRPTAMREVFLETPTIRWSDIGGQHEIKRRLQKAVERPLKMAERMKRLNMTSRKGILLYGPPGCSKTLLVKALATEAGLNFLAVKGAEMLSMYVGESERSLRELFRKARSASPSIIFFDEIDAIASNRSEEGRGNNGVNILTTLLNEMDGIEELRNVLVVAATNKPEALDPALMRPGRLDNLFYVGPPDLQAREEIFSLWASRSSVTENVDTRRLAELTEGYSGAEIVSICETAGEAALDEEENSGIEQQVDSRHFDLALTKVKKQITAVVTKQYEKFQEG